MDYLPLILFLKSKNIKYCENFLGAKLNYFEIGGNVKVVIYPECINQLCDVLREIHLKGYKYFLIGNGSNVYISNFYEGIIVSTSKINEIKVKNNYISASCGVTLSDASFMALYNGLSGLEFAFGIPGSIGGALYMNAAAYGGQMSNIVYKSTIYDIANDVIYEIDNFQHDFYHKHSVFNENKNMVLLNTVFKLKPSNTKNIYAVLKENLLKRICSQPLEYGSAGSTFKRPEGNYASRLIDECNLKGYSINSAEISSQHAGFIVNRGNANSNDINQLIEYTEKAVFEKYNIKLEKEIILVE